MNNNSIDLVTEFIKENFKEKKYANNYKNLIIFLLKNPDIEISEEDANKLLIDFPLLFKSIDESFDLIDEEILLRNKSIENLINSHRSICMKEINNNLKNQKSFIEDDDCIDLGTNDLDLIKLYLNEIGSYPLLTKEEEHNLGVEIKNGNEEAIHELVKHNLRLVIFVIKKQIGTYSMVPIGDLIQEGNIGLLNAAQNFDVDKDCRFSSYAVMIIKDYIKGKILDTSRVIRIPRYTYRMLNKMLAIETKYKKVHNGVEPSLEILSNLTGYDVDKLRLLKNIATAVSLSASVGFSLDDYDITTEEENINSVDNQMFLKSFIRDFNKSSYITEREQEILKYRFGLIDGKEYKLEEIGEKYNITKERVRQIINDSCKALREDPYMKTYCSKYMSIPLNELTKDDRKLVRKNCIR